nr:hypothetical protein TorRG33x02_241540 [Ipomoea batatas]
MVRAEVLPTRRKTARLSAKAQRELVPKTVKSNRKPELRLRTGNSTRSQGIERKRRQLGATYEQDLNHNQSRGLKRDGGELQQYPPGIVLSLAVGGNSDADGDRDHISHVDSDSDQNELGRGTVSEPVVIVGEQKRKRTEGAIEDESEANEMEWRRGVVRLWFRVGSILVDLMFLQGLIAVGVTCGNGGGRIIKTSSSKLKPANAVWIPCGLDVMKTVYGIMG